MAFCATCGAQVEGRFCAKCGAAVAAAASPGPQQASPVYQPPPAPVAASAPMADNVASTLCYVLGFITGILFLVLSPYNQNRTVRFHAFQSIFLSVAWLVIRWGLILLLSMVHLFGLLMLGTLGILIFLAGVALWIFMLVSTYQGKQIVLPIIGPLAQQQAG
jgi:uncharacterized membrane protein